MDATRGVVEEHLRGLRAAVEGRERARVGAGADREDGLGATEVERAAGLGDLQIAAGLEGRGAGGDDLVMLRACGETPDFDVERAGFEVVAGDVDRAGRVARGERTEVGQVADDVRVAAEGSVLEDADCGAERAIDDELTDFDVGVAGVGVDAGEGQRARTVLPEAAGATDGAGDRGIGGGIEDAARAGEGDVIGDSRAVGHDGAAVIERQQVAD